MYVGSGRRHRRHELIEQTHRLHSPPSPVPGAAPLVGRGAELARLRGCLDAARSGEPQFVFVDGEAGIGKSRLLRTFQRHAAHVGVEVLPGRCLEHFDLPYLPFRGALFARLTEATRDAPALEGAAALIDRVLDASEDDVPLDGSCFTPELARFLHTVVKTTITLARKHPLLITVDDLHWADGPSLDLLVQLVGEASDAAITGSVPLCFVGTFRPRANERLTRDLARFLREEVCHHVELGPLDDAAATELVRDLGLDRASRQLVAAVLRATGGNPLLIESAVRQLLRGGVRDDGGELVAVDGFSELFVPDELSTAATARVDALGPEAHGVLATAAVVGEEFSTGDLAAIAGVDASVVEAVVAEAVANEVITRDRDRLTFANPIFARVLRASTPPDRREAIHLAAAQVLRRSATPHDVTLTVGWHLAAAGAAANPADVVDACVAAGERSWQLSAWAEAARYYDAAAGAARRGNLPRGTVAGLVARAGAAHCRNLDPGPGRRRLREAIDLFEAEDDRVGAVGSWIELLHAQTAWGAFGQYVDLAPLEALLPEIEDDDVVLCARGYAQLAESAWPQGRVSQSERHAARALELAERGDDANARTRAHLARAQARWLRFELEAARDDLLRARQVGEASGDPVLASLALPRLALNLLWLGHLDDAARTASGALARAEEMGNFAEQSLARSVLTAVSTARGDFAAAETHAESAVAAIRLSRYAWSASLVFPALVSARLAQGDLIGARTAIDQWRRTVADLDDASYHDTIELVDLLVDLEADDRGRARRRLRDHPRLAAADQAVFIGGVQRIAALVELAAVVDDADAFAGWAASLDRAAAHGMVVTEGLVTLLPRVRADLHAAAGETLEAESAYRDAIATARAIGAEPELARAELGIARVVRARDADLARDAATDARARFAALGMPVCEHEARTLLATMTGVALDEGHAAVPEPTVLSRDTIVLLFTDVVDSTGLTEQLGDEVYIARAEALDTQMRRSIATCGGEPEDGVRPGDGILAFFHLPEQALRCAAAAHEHADANGLRLHVGLHMGPVIRARTGIRGGAVNLAARVCSLAPPGVTLTSAAVRHAEGVDAVATFEEFGVHRLKGITEPQLLFVVRPLPTTH